MADTLVKTALKSVAGTVELEMGYAVSLIERGLSIIRDIEPDAKALEGFDDNLVRAKCGEITQAAKVIREVVTETVKAIEQPRPQPQNRVDEGKASDVRAAKGA